MASLHIPVLYWLKRVAPQSLFLRALLILVLPTVLVQVVSTYMFYERHWENVSRHMAAALSGEINYLYRQLEHAPPREQRMLRNRAVTTLGIRLRPIVDGKMQKLSSRAAIERFPELAQKLRHAIGPNIGMNYDAKEEQVQVYLPLKSAIWEFTFSRKRLESATTYIYIMWLTGSSLFFLLVAVLFLRNQVKPIISLANAAERFGRGMDEDESFRPRGAREVRRAGRAFLIMRERIRRQLSSRTEMLAGISHDLRTPITRMKLQLALLPETEDNQNLKSDVEEMEKMIEAYLAFARGEGAEKFQTLSLAEIFAPVLEAFRHRAQDISFTLEENPSLKIRPLNMQRCLQNLVGNAMRYAHRCHITAGREGEYCTIWVDDDGNGIPESERLHVFKAFRRLENSRNPETGGVGLGLTIARDAVLGHGGTIELTDSPMGGLRVIIYLPL
jgi:two-component system osmolarity sensor histidine kinase EnvZ